MVQQKLDIGFFTSMYSQTNGTAHAVRFLSEAIAKHTGHKVHVYAPGIQKPQKIPARTSNGMSATKTCAKAPRNSKISPIPIDWLIAPDLLPLLDIFDHLQLGKRLFRLKETFDHQLVAVYLLGKRILLRLWRFVLGLASILGHNTPLSGLG